MPRFQLCVSLTAFLAALHAASAQNAARPAEVEPSTVVSTSYRRWGTGVGLKVILRDVDQPDSPIASARIVLERRKDIAGSPLYATSDSGGMAVLAALDTGAYHVRILSIGRERLEFTVRLQGECQQILEVYVARSVDSPGDVIYTAGHEPKRRWSMPAPTPGRVVLTTCPPLPNGR